MLLLLMKSYHFADKEIREFWCVSDYLVNKSE